MANVATTTPLDFQETAAVVTHKFVIPYTLLVTAGGATTSATIQLYVPTMQSTLISNASFILTTAFDASDASINSLLIEVGDASDTDRFLPQKELAVDGTEITAFATANATGTTPYLYKTADAITAVNATFTVAGGASPTMAELTSGSVTVFLKIVELASV